MVVIRLSRSGAKKRPFYHVVVSDSRNKRDGSYIERVGFNNPVAGDGEDFLRLDRKRIEYWQAHGAQTSLAVQRLLRAESRLPVKQEKETRKAEKSKFKPAQIKAVAEVPAAPAASQESPAAAAPVVAKKTPAAAAAQESPAAAAPAVAKKTPAAAAPQEFPAPVVSAAVKETPAAASKGPSATAAAAAPTAAETRESSGSK